MVDDFKKIRSNPQKLVLTSLASLIFLNRYIAVSNEPILIEIDNDEVLKSVRNRGSLRKPSSKWGISMDTFLERKISFKFSRKKVFPKGKLNSNKDVYISDTGQLVWDKVKKYMTINSQWVKGAVGFIADKNTEPLKAINISSQDDGVVILVSLDREPLSQSKKMLLACVWDK